MSAINPWRVTTLKAYIVLVVMVVGTAGPAHANDWTELGANGAGTRESPEISSPEFAPAWRLDLKSGPIIATPVTAGGRIVVAGWNGAVASLKAADGATVWTRTLPEGVRATPTIARERVIVSTMGGMLYALGIADGETSWQRSFGGQNYSSPQLVAGSAAEPRETVVIGAGFPSQDVWRFDTATGDSLWQTPHGAIPALVYSTAVIAGSRVVIGMNGGRFQSLDLSTGAPSWKLDASGPVYLSSPLVVRDRVYAFPADQGAHLYGVDATSGAPLAGFPVAIPDPAPVAGTQPFGQGPAVSSPMTAGGLIIVQLRRQSMVPSRGTYVVYMHESVVAIDPGTAQVRWQYALADVVAQNTNEVPELGLCATPVGFSGPNGPFVAALSSIAGRVVVLDIATGQVRWSATMAAPGRSSPVFSNGQLLVATDDGVLTAFASKSNHSPTAPNGLEPSGLTAFVGSGNVLRWQDATDLDGGPLSYVVRIAEEGTPDSAVERSTAPGESETTLGLSPEKSYVFTVRTRDAQGALSAWSMSQSFRLGASASAVPTTAPGMEPDGGGLLPDVGAPSSGGDVPPFGGAGPPPGGGGSPPSGDVPAATGSAPGSSNCASPSGSLVGSCAPTLTDAGTEADTATDGSVDCEVADAYSSSTPLDASLSACGSSEVNTAHSGPSPEDAGCAVGGAGSFGWGGVGVMAMLWAARRRLRRVQSHATGAAFSKPGASTCRPGSSC